MGNSRSRHREATSHLVGNGKDAKKSAGDSDSNRSSFLYVDAESATPGSLEQVDAVGDARPPQGMVAVTMQYSHRLGQVSEGSLQNLLKRLSDGCSDHQWTLSAPIQVSPDLSTNTATGQTDTAATTTATTNTPSNYFCSTYPIAGASALTGWPYGITEQTNTVMLELWLQLTIDNTVDGVSKIEGYVRKIVSSWLSETVNSTGQIWIMSRFMTPTTEESSKEKSRKAKGGKEKDNKYSIEKIVGLGNKQTQAPLSSS